MKPGIKTMAMLTLIIVLAIVLVNCTSGDSAKQPPLVADMTDVVNIERGRHLVVGGACNDCHSPKIMTPTGPQVDSSRILSGHPAGSPLPPIDTKALTPGSWVQFAPDLTAFVGPWGLSFAANLTPDSATGIGAWTESNFVYAIRKGKHMGMENGRPIAPPMPWENYSNLSDNDLKSIFAYLKTLPPISNRVHEPYSPDEVRKMK